MISIPELRQSLVIVSKDKDPTDDGVLVAFPKFRTSPIPEIVTHKHAMTGHAQVRLAGSASAPL